MKRAKHERHEHRRQLTWTELKHATGGDGIPPPWKTGNGGGAGDEGPL